MATLDELTEQFNRVAGSVNPIGPPPSFDQLVTGFTTKFATTNTLLTRMHWIVSQRDDPKASVQLQWIRSQPNAKLLGTIEAVRSGYDKTSIVFEYQGGSGLVVSDPEDRQARTFLRDDELAQYVCEFFSTYFR